MADQTTTIPKGWRMTTIGEVADVQNGYAFKSDDFSKSGVPIIKIKNIASGKITLDDLDYYSHEIGRLKPFHIQNGDILVSMTGSHISQISSAVGKVAKYNLNYVSSLNQRVGKIYPKKDLSDNSFLWFLLSQPEVQYFWGSKEGGSANQANISPSVIKSYEFVLPPLIEQRAIATVLLSLDNKIELLHEQNKTLETVTQTIFKEWFVKFNFPEATGKMIDSGLGKIPVGWRVFRFDEIMEFTQGTYIPKEEYKIDGINTIYGSNSIMGKTNKKTHDGAVIILAKIGSYCGAIRYSQGDCWINNNAGGIKGKNISTAFIYELLKYFNFGIVREGSGQPYINMQGLKSQTFPLPQIKSKLLIKAAKLFDSYYEKIGNNESQIQILSIFRDTLLPKLIKGELRVKGFND